MKRVFICSAFRAETEEKMQQHLDYARQLCRYALEENCAPFAAHLLYPQILYPGVFDDSNMVERSTGIRAGLMFLQTCQELWFGVRHGLTEGMRFEIEQAAKSVGIPIYLVASHPDGGFIRGLSEKLPQA